MHSSFVGCENIATLARYDAVRRGHPLHHFYIQPEALEINSQAVEFAGAYSCDELGHVFVEQQFSNAFGADARRKHDSICARLN
jgi:hypothetical protein